LISPGDAALHAGKYLWALRHAADTSRHALDEVVLVSPGGGGRYPDEARTSVVLARPGVTDELTSHLKQLIRGSLI
jgi:hypothetical protein